MSFRSYFLLFFALLTLPGHGAGAPEQALKYYDALLKRPGNVTLFERFFDAWLDEEPVESLEEFLKSEAETEGGAAWSVLARYQLRRGQDAAAVVTLGKAIEASPGDGALLIERANVFLRQMKFDEARADLETAAGVEDKVVAADAAKLLGKALMREGKLEEAKKVWDELLARNPGDEDLLEDLVETAAAGGDAEQALGYMMKLIGVTKDPYKQTLREMRRGDLLAYSANQDEALKTWSGALRNVGEGSWLEGEILARIDSLFRRQDRLDLLMVELGKLAEEFPRRLRIHRQLAKLEAGQGKMDEAIGRFREVMKRSPGNVELREEFVRMLEDGERLEDATAELEKMIELAPGDVPLRLRMAALRDSQENGEASLAALEKALELSAADEAKRIEIAGLMLQYGFGERGEAVLEKLAETSTRAAEALAAEYLRSGRKGEAIGIWKKLTESGELELVLRSVRSISTAGEVEAAFIILKSCYEKFSSEGRFLKAFVGSSVAAEKPGEGVEGAIRLVRVSKSFTEISDSVSLAVRTLKAAEKTGEWRRLISEKAERSFSETCLLAALLEEGGDDQAVEDLLEGAEDPVVVRFHVALLNRRGEFGQAIAILKGLGDGAEGRKASFFKDMSELQLRAGDVEGALGTLEDWRQAAPGDKTPWTISSGLLRDLGRAKEAIALTRQGVSRFDGDVDLKASLGSLYENRQQWKDAEAIYWDLYDAADTPAAQSRWAGQLSDIAVRTLQVEELQEKLRERAKGNSRSLGPVLSLIELARATRDDVGRRELLLQGLRIKPGAVELRVQLATLEEESGDFDKAMATLREGVPGDRTNRLRSVLAQMLVRNGFPLKGMRELQKIAGESGLDPRSVEVSAMQLVKVGYTDEAIRFLEGSLPDGGDWRTQFLLATLLGSDGREAEAVPIFLKLEDAAGDLARLSPNGMISNSRFQNLSGDEEELMALMQYAQRMRGGGMTSFSGNSEIKLPAEASEARIMATVELAVLSKQSDKLAKQFAAGDGEGVGFVLTLLESVRSGSLDWLELLKAHPNMPGLLGLAIKYGQYGNDKLTEDSKKFLRERAVKADVATKYGLWSVLRYASRNEDTNWEELVGIYREAVEAGEGLIANRIAFEIIPQLGMATLSEDLKSLLRGVVTDEMTRPTGNPLTDATFRFYAQAAMGTPEEQIVALNDAVKVYREKFKTPGTAGAGAWGNDRPFNWDASPLYSERSGAEEASGPASYLMAHQPASLPPSVLRYIPGAGANAEYMVDPAELMPLLDRVESPALRIFIALKAGKPKRAEELLKMEPSAIEAEDFKELEISRLMQLDDLLAVARKIVALMEEDGKNGVSRWGGRLIYLTGWLGPEEKSVIEKPLRKTVESMAEQGNGNGYQGGLRFAAEAAAKLGFEDLVKKFSQQAVKPAPKPKPRVVRRGGSALGPAGLSGQATRLKRVRQQVTVSPRDRVRNFSRQGKHEAAARAILVMIRSGKARGSKTAETLKQVGAGEVPETIERLLKMADPGDSKSLTKRQEYLEICSALGREELAVAVLKELVRERPADIERALRLAFYLPDEDEAEAIEILSKAAEDERFAEALAGYFTGMDDKSSDAGVVRALRRLATWLEDGSPGSIPKESLGSVGALGAQLYFERLTSFAPSLMELRAKEAKEPEVYEELLSVTRRLVDAMLKYPVLSEEGFRLLYAGNALEVGSEDLDSAARKALLLGEFPEAGKDTRNGRIPAPFNYRSPTGKGSMSSTPFDEFSSVAWLTSRMGEVESAELLPAQYLHELGVAKPERARLLASLASLSGAKDLSELWEAGKLDEEGGFFRGMLRDAVISRSAKLPDTQVFYLTKLQALDAENVFKSGQMNQNDSLPTRLVTICLENGIAGNREELKAACGAVGKLYFPEILNNGGEVDLGKVAQRVGNLRNRLAVLQIDPTQAVALVREFTELGVPITIDERVSLQALRSPRFSTAEDALAFLEEIGAFSELKDWPRLEMIQLETEPNQTGGYDRSLVRKDIATKALAGLGLDDREEKKRLLDMVLARRPETFGSLITAAGLSDIALWQEMVVKAFTKGRGELAETPESQREVVYEYAKWLAPSNRADLPEFLEEKFKKDNKALISELLKRTDELLAQAKADPSLNPFQEMQGVVRKMALVDMDVAVELFLKTEKVFTENLTRGGTLGRETSGVTKDTYRDLALDAFLSSLRNQNTDGRYLAFEFFARIRQSEAAGRFTMASYVGSGESLLKRCGGTPWDFFPKNKRLGKLRLADLMGHLDEVPKKHREDVIAFFLSYEAASRSSHLKTTAEKYRKELAARKDVTPQGRKLQEMLIGIRAWDSDTEEQRKKTAAVFLSLLENGESDPVIRVQWAADFLRNEPLLLTDGKLAEGFVRLFTEYAGKERSVVNPIGLAVIEACANLPVSDESRDVIKAINSVFWKNARATTSAGHPDIPERAVVDIFLTAAGAGDDLVVGQLLEQMKEKVNEDLSILTRLILLGNFEAAKKLLPDAKTPMLGRTRKSQYYTEALDRQLKEFSETGADPLGLLRYECQALDFVDRREWEVREAAEGVRSRALADRYEKLTPQDDAVKLEILSQLLEKDDSLMLSFSEQVMHLAGQVDFPKVVDTLITERSDLQVRMEAVRKRDLYCRAALWSARDGDYRMLQTVLSEAARIRGRDGGYTEVNAFANQMRRHLPLLVCEVLARGNEGEIKALGDFWVEWFDGVGKLHESNQKSYVRLLPAIRFLCTWSGRKAEYEELIDKFTIKLNEGDLRYAREGSRYLWTGLFQNRLWASEGYREVRKAFAIAAFRKPELAPYFEKASVYGAVLANSEAEHPIVFEDEVIGTFIAEVREYISEMQEKELAAEALRTRQAVVKAGDLETMLKGSIRQRLTYVRMLTLAGDLERAQQLYDSIGFIEIGDVQGRERYERLGKDVEKLRLEKLQEKPKE